ncbi:MAG: TIGR00725 family protein [Nitrospirae bacterium]|nr:TIGR00725 family protein [Candidatus Manganitrophaceae bacterium]
MRKTIIGVMGPGERAHEEDIRNAYALGRLIAQEGWVLLTGGRNSGVMDAANRGAKEADGLTIGILPTRDRTMISAAVDIPILTEMGSARNNINVLTSDLIIACGMGTGTASEVALALKAGKPVILITKDEEAKRFFLHLRPEKVFVAQDPAAALKQAVQLLSYSKR